jgi:hypothetical protein
MLPMAGALSLLRLETEGNMQKLLMLGVLSLVLLGCGDDDKTVVEVDASTGAATGTNRDGGTRSLDAAVVSIDASTKVDRSGLHNVGTAPLDYGNRSLWACLPGNDPDECHADLTSTEILKDGGQQSVPHVIASAPAFD